MKLNAGDFLAGLVRKADGEEAWCRLAFCALRPNRRAKVFLVDYGTFAYVKIDDLRYLPEAAFVIKDMMAIKCQVKRFGVG